MARIRKHGGQTDPGDRTVLPTGLPTGLPTVSPIRVTDPGHRSVSPIRVTDPGYRSGLPIRVTDPGYRSGLPTGQKYIFGSKTRKKSFTDVSLRWHGI